MGCNEGNKNIFISKDIKEYINLVIVNLNLLISTRVYFLDCKIGKVKKAQTSEVARFDT